MTSIRLLASPLLRSAVFKSGAVVVALATLGLGCGSSGDVIAPPTELRSCEANSQCGDGLYCNGGQCSEGDCDPIRAVECHQDKSLLSGDALADYEDNVEPFCCRAWQLCQFDASCAPDPNAPIGGQCLENADCPNPGEFCSGGTCFQSAGRTPCTRDFQCASDERCDATILLCVPDQGGCTYAEEFPELACEQGKLCDVETGFCIEPIEAMCTQATVADDCPAGKQLCDEFGRCVQCITEEHCGPGTSCNEGTGLCFPDGQVCQDDDDCEPPRRCASANDECVVPQCQTDPECPGAQKCDLTTFKCYLAPAVCNENDEPNNGVGSATPLATVQANGGGTLCRGDVDYVSFPVLPSKLYRATVQFPDFNVSGNKIALLDEAGAQLDLIELGTDVNGGTLTGITASDESGVFYVKLTGGGEGADIWPYSITIVEEESPIMIDCDEQVEEPNDSFANAYPLTLTDGSGVFTFARCPLANGNQDHDYFRVDVPPQNGIDVELTFENEEGDLELQLYDGPSISDSIDHSDGAGSDTERVDGIEGPESFWIRTSLYGPNASGIPGQTYTLTVTLVPRPEACLVGDPNEPEDEDISTPTLLDVDTIYEGMRCIPQDDDYFTFTLPGNFGGAATLLFAHGEGDLRLEIYNPDDTLFASSNSSNPSNGAEVVELPYAAAPQTFKARVRINAGSGQEAQAYTFSIITYDASTCVASEPIDNGGLTQATCVGVDGIYTDGFDCPAAALPEPLNPPAALEDCDVDPGDEGCGRLCGANDEDWYRVGKLNDGQRLRARLFYDPGVNGINGRIGLALGRANANLTGVTFVRYEPNDELASEIDLNLNAPTVPPAQAREYAVIVRPEGSVGFNALPYRLHIDVGDPCIPDDEEPNNTPSEYTPIREGQTGDYNELFTKTLCGSDVDVYRFFGLPGEQIDVVLAGPPGLTVDIGEESNLDTAPTLPGGAGVPVDGPCPIDVPGGLDEVGDGGVVDSDAGTADGGVGEPPELPYACAEASFANDQVRLIYLTVYSTMPGSFDSVGTYALDVTVDAP